MPFIIPALKVHVYSPKSNQDATTSTSRGGMG